MKYFTRSFNHLNLVPVCASFLLSGCSQNDTKNSEKPNFLVILADDISAVDFGCYGSKDYHTPNIDKLAETGALFNVCWSTALSMPSRMQMMSGRYATSTGWYGNDFKPMGNEIYHIPGDPGYSMTDELFFSKLFHSNGYKTAISGKWHVEDAPDWNTFKSDYGYDEFCLWGLPDTLPKGYEDYNIVKGASGPYWDVGGRGPFWQPAININGKLGPTGKDDFGPDFFTGFINDFISRNQESPFLVYYPMTLAHSWWYNPVSEHTRWSAFGPVPELDSFGRKTGNKTPVGHKYAVEYMDHLIGEIVHHLDSLGLRKNTIIVFTADNGSPKKGKGSLHHENGVRVPLIVNCPAKFTPSRIKNSFAQLADVYPGICEMAGIEVPDSVKLDGISFTPVLMNDTVVVRDWLYSYVNYKHAFRYKDYFLNDDNQLFKCVDKEDGRIEYHLIPDSVTNEDITSVRTELEQLKVQFPTPDTLNNPMYERYKLVNKKFTETINQLTN